MLKNRDIVGIVRKFDKCGRITIPQEYKDYLGIDKNSEIGITMDISSEEIILKKIKKN